jgi:large subunit ribosomal protein L25
MPSRLVAETGRAPGSRSSNRLRAAGKIPGVLYGAGVEPTPIAIDAREFRAAMHGDHGLNAVLTIAVDGTDHMAMAKDIQRNATRGVVTHVDFVTVSRDIEVSADVPLLLVGESSLGGSAMVDVVLSTLAVRAKPQDVPAAVEIDQSGLRVGGHVTVAQLRLPAGVSTDADPDEIVVRVTSEDASAELESLDAEAAEAAEGDAAGEDAEATDEAAEGPADAGEATEG